MKAKLFALLVFSFSLWGAEPRVVSFDKLQHRGWLTYISNQDTPFTGKAVSFYANGQKRQEASYKDGKYDGLWSWWYENGQKSREENYKDGKENGLHPRWYENGQMRGEVSWKNGKRDGLWTKWHENGQIKGTGNHTEGSRHEHWVGWYDNGRLRDEVYYNGGLMERAIVWKPDGKKCPVTNVEAGSGVIVGYNQDGTEKYRFTYKDGEIVTD